MQLISAMRIQRPLKITNNQEKLYGSLASKLGLKEGLDSVLSDGKQREIQGKLAR